MNMMRHLKVPNADVERVFTIIKENNWLSQNMLIIASDERSDRLIPLNINAPENINEFLNYEVINHQGKKDKRINPNWLFHLAKLLDKAIFQKYYTIKK